MRPPSLPSVPYRLFATKHLRARHTTGGDAILSACGYFSKWNTMVHTLYDLVNGKRTSDDLARMLSLPHQDVRRILSLFALIGLVDLTDEHTGQSVEFDTYTVRRAMDLLFFEKDAFLAHFFFTLFQNKEYTMAESHAFFSFLQFVTRGGTTTKPFFQVLQEIGKQWNALSLSDGESAAIGLAFFVSVERTLSSWWNEERARALRNAFMIVTDVLLSYDLFAFRECDLLAVS